MNHFACFATFAAAYGLALNRPTPQLLAKYETFNFLPYDETASQGQVTECTSLPPHSIDGL
jgi:hypothetical protein